MGRFREAELEDNSESAIDMSPLIDCVFILLIFFIVTTVFVEETGVEVERPEAASAIQLEKTSILLAVTEQGQVIYGKKDIGFGGIQAQIKRLLLSEEDLPVIIQADEGADSAHLIRAVDEARLAGARKVSVATRAPKG